MNSQEFQKFTQSIFDRCRQILESKGPDYSGLEDRLRNFKEVATRAGTTPQQALWTYVIKHLQAIETYVKTGKLDGEPIDTKLIDIINYAILFLALEHDNTKIYDKQICKGCRDCLAVNKSVYCHHCQRCETCRDKGKKKKIVV